MDPIAPTMPTPSTTTLKSVWSPAQRQYLTRQGRSIIAYGGSGEDVARFAEMYRDLPAEEQARRLGMETPDTGGMPTQDPNLILGLSTKAYQGLTFGFGDEFSGTLAGILPGGMTPQEGRDAYREVLRAGSGHKVADFIAELAGGAVTGATAARAAGLTTSVGSQALAGGAGGAVAGFGNETGTITDRAKSALIGGAAGATLGLGFGVGAGIAGSVLRNPARGALDKLSGLTNDLQTPVQRLLDRLGKIGDSTQARLPGIGTSQDEARRVLLQTLRDEAPDGVDVFDHLRSRISALRDQGVSPTLADAAGENTLGVLARITQDRTPAKQKLVDALFARQAGQAGRLEEGLFRSIFQGDEFGLRNAYHAQDAIIEARARLASPMYTEAHREMVPVSNRMRELILGNPKLRAAYEEGRRIADSEDLTAAGQAALGEGRLQVPALPSGRLQEAAEQRLLELNVPAERMQEMLAQLPDAFPDEIPVRALDYMQRGLQRVKRRLAQGEGLDTREFMNINETLEEILGEATSASEVYGRARSTYANLSSAHDAIELGRGFFSKAPEVITRELEALEKKGLKGLQDLYRLGVMQDISDVVRDADAVEDAASKLFGADLIRGIPSNGTTQRLRAAFANPEQAEDFFRRAAAEARLSRTASAVGSTRPKANSAFEEAEQVVESAAPVGRVNALLNAWNLVRTNALGGNRKFRRRVADDMSEFFSRGIDTPESLDLLVESLEDFELRQLQATALRENVKLGVSSALGVSMGKLFGN